MNEPAEEPEECCESRWSVYLVRCAGGTLYTGIATDVARRVEEHEEGRGAKYLRGKAPLELVFERAIGERGRALRIEGRIKRLPRDRKEALLRDDRILDELLLAIEAE